MDTADSSVLGLADLLPVGTKVVSSITLLESIEIFVELLIIASSVDIFTADSDILLLKVSCSKIWLTVSVVLIIWLSVNVLNIVIPEVLLIIVSEGSFASSNFCAKVVRTILDSVDSLSILKNSVVGLFCILGEFVTDISSGMNEDVKVKSFMVVSVSTEAVVVGLGLFCTGRPEVEIPAG